MGKRLEQEQEIANEMNEALQKKQFVVYFQPKYDVKTRCPAGAEALVRWQHPQKGMVSPGAFIPVFERNGFISKLDYYVWENVCQTLGTWRAQGLSPLPVSVNISRVNVYNPKLVEQMCELTERYQVPRELFQLELTESAYSENPEAIVQTVDRLHAEGFTVLMDDFGSGYSSLNILKDILIDCLKIDMGFFNHARIDGRGENIIASVIRMAKWLNIPVIAEGVETLRQVDFLSEVGCDYIQGYYFARPMPRNEYEKLVKEGGVFHGEDHGTFDATTLWKSDPQMEMLFSQLSQAVAIFEVEGENIELLRANKAFYKLTEHADGCGAMRRPLCIVREEHRSYVLRAFDRTRQTKGEAECEYQSLTDSVPSRWTRLHLRYVTEVGGKSIVVGTLADVTEQKKVAAEVQRYREALQRASTPSGQLLIVEDEEINRAILREIFAGSFAVLEAQNGSEALELLRKDPSGVDMILLDLQMPVMDGKEFLRRRAKEPDMANIPLIIITAEDSPQQQIDTLRLGADDYIVKPFVSEIVRKRVRNVLNSHGRLQQALQRWQPDGLNEGV